MLLKAVFLALTAVFGGLGVLQVSAFLESYALLVLGLLLTMVGVLSLSGGRIAKPSTG